MNKYPYDHPMQDTCLDEQGTLRYKENAIVSHILNHARNNGCDLNDLARMDFSANDWRQFQQLHGYSISGFAELSWVGNPFGEEEYEDGYYEYMERQIPEYFGEDEELEQEAKESGMAIVGHLLEMLKEKQKESSEELKKINELTSQVAAEVERLRTENASLKEQLAAK